jgi:hypothetical protein
MHVAAPFMNHLNKLVGKQIIKLEVYPSTYYPINTSDSKLEPLTINELWINFGEYQLNIGNNYELNSELNNIEALVGQVIKEVIETNDAVKMVTTLGNILTINLRDEAFNGPEAMSLHGPENYLKIWN